MDAPGVSPPGTRGASTAEWAAALRAGFEIQSCAEVGWPDLPGGHGGSTAQAWCAGAARAAYVGAVPGKEYVVNRRDA